MGYNRDERFSLLPGRRYAVRVQSLTVPFLIFICIFHAAGCSDERSGTVVVKAITLKKTTFCGTSGPRIRVTNLTLGRDRDGNAFVAVVDRSSVTCVGVIDGKVREQFRHHNASDLGIFLQNQTEYYVFCPHAASKPARLSDRNGTKWVSGGDSARGAFGDVDGDAEPEFYIVSKAGTPPGLCRISISGGKVWQVATTRKFTEVDVLSSIPEGHGEVAALVEHSGIRRFDSEGRLLGRVNLPGDVDLFRAVRWPTGSGEVCFVCLVKRTLGRQSIAVVRTDGSMEFEASLPNVLENGYFSVLECTFVRFSESSEPILAIRARWGLSVRQSLLCLFSLNGTMLYEEFIGNGCGLVAVPMGIDSNGEVLLVGDGANVIRYAPR